MIPPTTRPRDASGARCAANGMSICTDTELKPTSSETSKNTFGCSAKAAPSRLRIATTVVTSISLRFSSKSPSGTRKNSPSA
ncbi:hypothetical protein ALQ20_200032 [Pseudomonas syringae pv. atrofaciens]|nr:hypothetical protein ALQ20_200032 [Pseudomonas syringae pv. atrofaciens]